METVEQGVSERFRLWGNKESDRSSKLRITTNGYYKQSASIIKPANITY